MARDNHTKVENHDDTGQALARLVGAEMDGNVPERVVVAPWGAVESTSGAFVVDEESGAAVVAAFAEHGTDLPIDFEHQTLGGAYSSPQGTAPAAGWITQLEAVDGQGIVATVNWTDEGRRMLASRAYRYLSPVALIRQDDRRLIGLHSVALTNKPAIVRMTPVVNRENQTVEHDAEAVVAALEESTRRQEAEGCVAAAQAAGKLTAAQREWALALALSDRVSFDEWLKTAPVVVATGRIAAPVDAFATTETARRSRARSEYRAERTLQALTSEDAYIADALRERLN